MPDNVSQITLRPGSHYFFCGIGGAGMNPLAHILAARGFQVSGSDCSQTPVLDDLRANGVPCFAGHHRAQIDSADVLVYSSAIPSHNPELVAARQKGMVCLHRSDVLAGLVNAVKGVAVAGAHGKTTVSALTALIFAAHGSDPTAVIGGFVPEFDGYYRNGSSDWIIVEADESDGSFQKIIPLCAVLLNIDSDHLDYYGSIDDIVKAFSAFCRNVKPGGALVYNRDADYLSRVVSSAPDSVAKIACSSQQPADFRAHSIVCNPWSSEFVVSESAGEYRVQLGIPGRHNVANALQAVAAARWAGVPVEIVQRQCRAFHGVHRRFQLLGSFHGAAVIDDYAHHPREIEATLVTAATLRSSCLVVFQPHRFSRTVALLDEFVAVLATVDRLILTDIYSANEPNDTISGRILYDRIKTDNPACLYCEHIEDLPHVVARQIQPDDVILFLGAGSISRIAHTLVENEHDEDA